jgi:hypothetical protein
MGIGVATCGEFAQDYRRNPSQAEIDYFNWAQGYMSGANVRGDFNLEHNLSAWFLDQQREFLRRYCNEHPLANYYSAVIELYGSLPLSHPK